MNDAFSHDFGFGNFDNAPSFKKQNTEKVEKEDKKKDKKKAIKGEN